MTSRFLSSFLLLSSILYRSVTAKVNHGHSVTKKARVGSALRPNLSQRKPFLYQLLPKNSLCLDFWAKTFHNWNLSAISDSLIWVLKQFKNFEKSNFFWNYINLKNYDCSNWTKKILKTIFKTRKKSNTRNLVYSVLDTKRGIISPGASLCLKL